KIDALQDQAAQLQAQVGGGHPDWGMSGSAIPKGAELAVANINAAGGQGGGAGWINTNPDIRYDAMRQAREEALSSTNADMFNRGNPSFEELEAQFSTSPHRMTAEQAALSASGGPISGSDIRRQEELGITPSGGQGWVDPNAPVPGSFEDYIQQGANLPHKDFWDRIPATGVAPTGGGQGWVNPNTVVPDWYNVNEQIAYPTAMGTNLPFMDVPADVTVTGTGQTGQPVTAEELALVTATGTGAQPPVVAEEIEETTLAPKYSPQTVGYQTHEQMYPNHRNAAAMAGVASIKAQFDGSHKAWIEGINNDMKTRGIELTHEINGVKTNKHSSADWKEYNDLFTVGEDGVPRDSNGVAMFGTDKQAQAGLGGVLQGLWGGILSGAEKIFQPSTSSGVVDPYSNLGYPDYASGNIPANIRQPATVGDDTRGDNPIDTMRSIYPWARSLPNDILFNAARYPDYLRLLIEADATGKELPLVVPEWILEGRENPNTNTNTNGNGNGTTGNVITNHPAMQTQQAPAGWGSAPWLT
ncbi:MAG: hypothetical protein QF535_06965, partial [Anaerolineales bacterium]|nr:hypothetical protein [Anaerolineales bacterium]